MPIFEHESRKNPIYIYAPRYIKESAGIRTLHYLCHIFNQEGFLSWIAPSDPITPGDPYVSGSLNTPLLTKELIQEHFTNALAPIVIYPETITGNPLGAQIVCRWLLNFPGALGGPKTFDKQDFVFSYSKTIADYYGQEIPVIFIPPVSLDEISSIPQVEHPQSKHGKAVVYAGKFRDFVGKPRIPDLGRDFAVTEIWRDGPKKQKREDVLKLVSEAEVLFAFENTTLITEAALLGTPVILVASDFFQTLIAEAELGSHGTAWSYEANAIDVASQGVSEAQRIYREKLIGVNFQVQRLGESLQDKATGQDYLSPVRLPRDKSNIKRKIQIAFHLVRSQGPSGLILEVAKHVNRRRAN